MKILVLLVTKCLLMLEVLVLELIYRGGFGWCRVFLCSSIGESLRGFKFWTRNKENAWLSSHDQSVMFVRLWVLVLRFHWWPGLIQKKERKMNSLMGSGPEGFAGVRPSFLLQGHCVLAVLLVVLILLVVNQLAKFSSFNVLLNLEFLNLLVFFFFPFSALSWRLWFG